MHASLHNRANLTSIQASCQHRPLRVSYSEVRNGNETREKPWVLRRFLSTWETGKKSLPTRPISQETKQSARVFLSVAFPLGCTRKKIPKESMFRFFLFIVFQLLP